MPMGSHRVQLFVDRAELREIDTDLEQRARRRLDVFYRVPRLSHLYPWRP
jgi:hypothetical protein